MPQSYGVIQASAMPAAGADAAQKQLRTDEFGGLHVRSELLAWVQEGSYFRACNPTMGTGVAWAVQTAFSDTANVLLLVRNGSASKKILPHYLRLICTAAGTGATSAHMAIVTDTANRYSSGGTDLLASAFNANSALAPSTAADQVRYTCTAVAVSAKRTLARFALKTQAAPCFVVGDEYRVNFAPFGDADPGLISGAGAACYVKNVGPVLLGGQNHCLLFHLWAPAVSAAPSFEYEFAWWER